MEDDYRKLTEDSFEAIRSMINHLERNLKSYTFQEQVNYLMPIRSILSEANMHLYDQANKRVVDGESVINNIVGNED